MVEEEEEENSRADVFKSLSVKNPSINPNKIYSSLISLVWVVQSWMDWLGLIFYQTKNVGLGSGLVQNRSNPTCPIFRLVTFIFIFKL